MTDQLDLFGAPSPRSTTAVQPAAASPELEALAARVPATIRFGTSSWSFPGWQGIVWAHKETEQRLSRHGLAAYAQHPLLRAVGVDRTLYSPVEPDVLRGYRDAVPDDFRFLVKFHEDCLFARFPDHPRYGTRRGQSNPLFFDPGYATDAVVGPYLETIGPGRGALLLQFAPQPVDLLGGPEGFADRLHAFLTALPPEIHYAVELRNATLLTPYYGEALRSARATHCINLLPQMPDPYTQYAAVGGSSMPSLIVRWQLIAHRRYADARNLFTPFDAIVEPDIPSRLAIAHLVADAHAAGKPALVIVNNKAEGCSPLSVVELARAVVDTVESTTTPAT